MSYATMSLLNMPEDPTSIERGDKPDPVWVEEVLGFMERHMRSEEVDDEKSPLWLTYGTRSRPIIVQQINPKEGKFYGADVQIKRSSWVEARHVDRVSLK